MLEAIHVARCSGFLGDRLAAAREIVDAHREGRAHVDVLADCLAVGIRVVADAGGLNPAGCAAALDALGTGARVAEIAADGSAVVTKPAGTGGAVTVETITARLLHEIDGPRYLTPDVVARFDTLTLEGSPRHGRATEGSLALDAQAKGLGEFVRARHLDIPEELLP